jgi:hypothetical protein
MKLQLKSLAPVALGLALWAPLAAVHAANTMTITYYTVGETDQDANHLAGGTFNNEVQDLLGPHGLPVLNTTAYGCTSNCFSAAGAPQDVLANGEITYWSPALNNGGAGGTSDVTLTGTDTVTLPFNVPYNFFPPNGTGSSDYNGFQAATLTGTLNIPTDENISFSIGADDMAFAYLDGKVVCDLGGVHGSTAGSCVTDQPISAGDHTLQVFFVDMNNVQSGLYFDVTTSGATTKPTVPEPETYALMGLGLAAIAWAARRRASA